MERDFLQKEAKKATSPNNKSRQTQSVMKARDPPNFDKLHKNFEEALERKRKENKTTEIKEFKFYSTTKDGLSKIKAQETSFEQQKQRH
jgi:L-fucose mutarotase/ribose pyranase (RbsD/FucU family)